MGEWGAREAVELGVHEGACRDGRDRLPRAAPPRAAVRPRPATLRPPQHGFEVWLGCALGEWLCRARRAWPVRRRPPGGRSAQDVESTAVMPISSAATYGMGDSNSEKWPEARASVRMEEKARDATTVTLAITAHSV
eukprot:5879689-Prymnesium_polylepis.1